MKAGAQDYINKGNLARLIPAIERELIEAQGRIKRKLAEEALQKSEEKYRRIVETSNEGIWMFDSERRTTFVNARLLDMLGYTSDEMLGRKMDEFIIPEELDSHLKEMEKRRKGEKSHYERRFLRKDNDLIYCSVSATPLFDERGQFIGSFGMFADITAQKQAQEYLNILKVSIDTASDAAFWTDQDGKFIYINESACKSLGYDRDELMKMRIYDMNPRAYPGRWREVFEEFRKHKRKKIESIHRRKDGTEFPVEVVSSYVTLNGHEYLCGFARDISERRQAEDEIRRLNAGLEKKVLERTKELENKNIENIDSQKALMSIVEDVNLVSSRLEIANKHLLALDNMKSMFIATTSHELRTPLNSIIGFSSILLEGGQVNLHLRKKKK